MPASLNQSVPYEGLDRIVIGEDKERYFQVRTKLPPGKKKGVGEIFKGKFGRFAWSAYEAPRVDLEFICHSLNVNPSVVPRK